MSEWQNLLREAVNNSSRTAVAQRLGVSRAAVSLLCNDKYPGGTERMARRILRVLGGTRCPVSGEQVTGAECAARRAEAMPTANPYALRQWRTCQHCPLHRQRDFTGNAF